MIYEQLLWALGYEGTVIALTEDYRSNRHIALTKKRTLCGKPMKLQKKALYNTKGHFLGYEKDSFQSMYGFYGPQRCKECLRRYLRHRLSPQGEKLVRQYHARIALRLPVRIRR